MTRAFARNALILGALLVALPATTPSRAATKKDVCTASEKKDADKWLWLNSRDKRRSIAQNLPWGEPTSTPAATNEIPLIQWEYVIDYDPDLRVPLWTAERIVASKLKSGRSDCFRADVRLPPAEASTPGDYKEPIFDQGHMTPNGDVTVSRRAMHNSFIMSNMSPQFCEFNRGIWQILEQLVRRWAHDRGTVYVVNGSVFDRDGDGLRDSDDTAVRMKSSNGNTRVAVPTAFYKIVAAKRDDGTIETLTVLLPQDHSDRKGQEAIDYLQQKVTKIGAIEALTGLHFFPNLTSSPTEAQALWPYHGGVPSALTSGCKTP